MTTRLPLVVVKWADAWVDGNEPVSLGSEVAITHKPKIIVTVGWLLREDEDGVSVANEHYEDENVYRGRTYIPRAMITSIERYRLTRERAPRAPNPPSILPES
jgi:hypothetical protein